MNIYRIEISSFEDQNCWRKTIGYSSALNEYDPLTRFGFRNCSKKDNGQTPITHQDEWMYTASNAVGCLVYATRV